MSTTPKGTVLLRQARPKYGYVGKKLPKEPSTTQSTEPASEKQPGFESRDAQKIKKPVAIVEASYKATPSSFDHGKPFISTNLLPNQESSSHSETELTSSSHPSTGSVNLPLSDKIQASYTTNVLSSNTGDALPSSSSSPEFSLVLPGQSTDKSGTPEENNSIVQSTAASLALVQIKEKLNSERIEVLEKERDKLKQDLDVQLQVNAELKKLLVASVGEDLSTRVERLARDRAQLSTDIGGFSKKINEDNENLDQVSIQADMWRSKYLAARVMVEELGNARAFYSLQAHEAQDALQQMLNERHELRTNLLEAYKILQQVKGAFDPLNSYGSFGLPSTNVLDLSRACQQMGEAIRFRLLPAHVSLASSTELDTDCWSNSVTKAEQLAHDLLCRPSEPVSSLQAASSQVLPIAAAKTPSSINRFHPRVRHENLTITCKKCKGDIHVV